MKLAVKLGMLLAMMILLAYTGPAEVIDRIIATVNGVPLLQSDLEDSVRFEAFLQQRELSTITAADREAAFNRLVDQELLRQQMQGDPSVSAEAVNNQISEMRAQTGTAGNDVAWGKLLAGYGLDETMLRSSLGARLAMMHFVDLRLRPAVKIDRDAIEAYYRDILVPKLKQMGATVDPLPAVAPKIQELLAQQRMDEMLTMWLANLRSQSKIHIETQLPQTAHAGATHQGSIR